MKIIEVEKKFSLNNKEKESLIKGSENLGIKIFTDTYYDNQDKDLTTKDIWLRERDNKWELKIPVGNPSEQVSDQYKELTNEEEIKKYLNFDDNKTLNQSLIESNYKPFASITTRRAKYKKGGLNIDIDEMDFGYEIAEIEKMVEDEQQIQQATKEILEFANEHNLTVGKIRGKVIEYLRRNNIEHFNKLISAGVLSEQGDR